MKRRRDRPNEASALNDQKLEIEYMEMIEALKGGAGKNGEARLIESLLADPDVVAEMRRLRRPSHWFVSVPALAAAAALVLLVTSNGPEEPGHRAAGSGVSFEGMTPAGEVGAIEKFNWPDVAGASEYEVMIFDRVGEVLVDTTVTSSELHPADFNAMVGGVYFWRVRARVDVGRWVDSPLTEFKVERAR